MAENSFNGVESLNEIVEMYEKDEKWLDNTLNQYHSYAYNLELFIVDQSDAVEFLINEQSKLEQVATDNWPTDDIKSIIIAATGTTTEFNIQDLQVESLGPGSTSTSKLVGSATKLSFSIVQVGNTSLNDSLMNVALLSGYTSIAKATYFLKIKFKGFNEAGIELTTDTQNTTKVLPFVISNVGDVPSSTDARGTVTTIEGTIAIDRAVSAEVNLIEDPFQFDVKDTLEETLESFTEKLNETVAKNNYADDDQFINMYDLEFDDTFINEYAQSPMNGPNKNTASATPKVAKRINNLNLSQQSGNITTGLSIIDILYDICIQAQDVRKELTTENDGFTKVINITARVAPKKDGLNVLTGKTGHWVKYYIGFKETLVAQNKIDEANKVSHAAKNAKHIFEKNRCRKIYYYQYTGMNDQILDLQLSFNRQLVKAFVRPNDAYFYKKFLDGANTIENELNPKARARLDELRNQIETNTQDVNDAKSQVESVKAQLETQETELSNSILDRGTASILSSLPAGEADMAAGDLPQALKGKSIQEQLQVIRQYDPDFQLQGDLLDRYNELGKQLDDANRALGNQTTERARLEAERAEVYEEAIGAKISKELSNERGSLSQNLETIGNTDDIILMEELGDEFITTLTKGQFEALLETLQYNPTVFSTQVIPKLDQKNKTIIFTPTDPEDVEQARQKFYEGVNLDISMQQLDMTIKGDPFWIDTYQIPTYVKETFNGQNINESFPHHPSDLESANYVIIVTNKAAGVDENDNLKIANLQTMLYAVKSITSSFSGGQFTQQLNMVKIPTPSNFKQLNPTFGPGVVELDDSDYLAEAFGHLGGGSNRPTYGTGDGTDPDAGDPRGNQIGNGNTIVPITELVNPNNLPVGANATAQEDANGNVGNQQSLDGASFAANSLNTLVTNADTPPTGSQATQIQNSINQNKYLCDLGAQVSCDAVNRAYADMARGVEGLTTEEILEGLGDTEDLSPAGVALLQDSLENQGAETFNADDIPNANITQAQVDFARQEADDAAASYYIGNNGIVENPVDAMTDMETGGRFGQEAARNMLDGEDPYVSEGFERKMYADQTGRAPRSIDVDVDPKTLTPSEYEKVSRMNAEIVEITNGKSLYELTDDEWERVQELEAGINGVADASTKGVRGQVRDEVINRENRERISDLQAESDHLTDELDGFYWTTAGRREDEEKLEKVNQELLAMQNETSPYVMDDVVRIVNPETGEAELAPTYKLQESKDIPVVIKSDTPPVGVPSIDNGDGTFTVPSSVREGNTSLTQDQASQLDGATGIYDDLFEQIDNLPRKDIEYSLDLGEGVETWTENVPDTSALQPIEYVDSNGQTQTITPEELGIEPGSILTAATMDGVMGNISELYPLVGSGGGKSTQGKGQPLRTTLNDTRFYVLEEEE